MVDQRAARTRAVGSAGTDYAKLSPDLAAAADDYGRLGSAALAHHLPRLGIVSTGTMKGPRGVVFVRCADDAELTRAEAAGLRLNQSRGRWRTGVVPLAGLEGVSEDGAVERIVAARRLRLLMDVAPAKVGVPVMRRAGRLSGRGVVVGTVDSGIQATHPDFGGRVLRIWDQTLSGPGVVEGNYGLEAEGPHLEVSRDTIGHGTHVAGIAAGEDSTYGGVAPEADLVVVKTDLLDAHIADGIRYVFRVAGELGRPAVVNLSLGGQADAHDGTDPLSAIIDHESGPGRIVCCAAGNEGNDDIHARIVVGEDRPRTITFTVPAAPDAAPAQPVSLQGWYPGADVLEVAVASPAGTETAFQGVITESSPVRTYELPEGQVQVVTPGPDPDNGDHNFLVQLRPSGRTTAVAPSGAWRLRLRGARGRSGRPGHAPGGQARVDVWALSEGWAAQFSGRAVSDSLKVGAPGAASQAVTVAAYTTKVEWFDLWGGIHGVGLEPDDISDFSSAGPRRDGANKPDVTAPGAMIVSSLSAHTPILPEVVIDGFHTVMSGTSMATPFVSGLVALLLQRDPTLDPAGVKRALAAHSSVPGEAPGTFDAKWGLGLIDAAPL